MKQGQRTVSRCSNYRTQTLLLTRVLEEQSETQQALGSIILRPACSPATLMPHCEQNMCKCLTKRPPCGSASLIEIAFSRLVEMWTSWGQTYYFLPEPRFFPRTEVSMKDMWEAWRLAWYKFISCPGVESLRGGCIGNLLNGASYITDLFKIWHW